MMKRTILLTTYLIFIAFAAHAQTTIPPLINYQGKLTNATGQPMTGSPSLAFDIYDAQSMGTKVWGPQVFASVPLLDGSFNVILGTTDASGRSIIKAFTDQPRYLEITVNGSAISPRQQILMLPMRFRRKTEWLPVP